MMNYIEVKFKDISETLCDLFIAKLSEMGFNGMEEINGGLIAYIDEAEYKKDDLLEFVDGYGIAFTEEIIKEQNWNELWESNFDPVVIPGKVHIRAHFHPKMENIEHEILITPKMSFGTGHHATTRMMMHFMLKLDFHDKKVIDFGTGTGILAILAEQLGASSIEAIDNDIWSINNIEENRFLNNCQHIISYLGTNLNNLGNADIFLANINKIVLIDHAKSIFEHMNPGCFLVISGLLEGDYDDISAIYKPYFGNQIDLLKDTGWISILFQKIAH